MKNIYALIKKHFTKKRTKERIKGSMTLMMVIILLPTMVFGGIIVDTARINMAKAAVSSAGDLAMNSTLANYDTVLKEVYGLFAMSQNKTQEEITNDVMRYFENTMASTGVVSKEDSGTYVQNLLGGLEQNLFSGGESEVSNFINMDMLSLNATPLETSSLAQPGILKKQIVEYMKYRAPVEFGMSFFDSLKTFSSISSQSEVVEKMVEAQENTQEVTEACKLLMEKIREYDSKFDEFALEDKYDTSKKIVVWQKNETKDYAHALLNYRENWGANYKDINKLNLVFLSKEISNGDIYLYDKSGSFITQNGSDYNVQSGWVSRSDSVSMVNENDKQTSLNNIINKLKNINKAYSVQLNSNCIANDEVTKIDDACNQFTNFRVDAMKSVTDTSGMKYVLDLLEQARYCWSDSQSKLSQAERDKSTAETDKQNADSSIDTAETNIVDVYNQMIRNNDNLSNAQNSRIRSLANEQLSFTTVAMDRKINTYKRDFQDDFGVSSFDSYNGTTVNDKYGRLLSNTADEGNYLSAQHTNTGLIHGYMQTVVTKVGEYNDAESRRREAQGKIDELNAQKTEYNNILKQYKPVIDNYQKDIKTQKSYVSAAKNTVTRFAKEIKEQFDQIHKNLEKLRDISHEIEDKLDTVIEKIEEYNRKVDEWKNTNATNASKNPDSFVSTNNADIEATTNEYDLDGAKKLKEWVHDKTEGINRFLTQMDNEAKFVYGGKRINKIDKWQTAKSAANDTLGGAKFYTLDEANSKFGTLYKAPTKVCSTKTADGNGPTFVPSLEYSKQFVKNGVYGNSSFLAYLKKTYPELPPDSIDGVDYEQNYEDLKSNSKDNSAKNVAKDDDESGAGTDEEGNATADKYGYIYKNRSTDNPFKPLPSNCADQLTVTQSDKDTADGGGGATDKVNVSGNMSSQSNIVSTMLGGIGDALKAGRDNVYVLEYIFQNFSYNTMVQEALVKGETGKDDPADLTDLIKNEFDEDLINTYKGKCKTLSNYLKNENNNYLNGAEIEYILYGNSDAKTNVTYAKASIFAIRFVLNAIYAFTNTDIRNQTKALGVAVQTMTGGFVPAQVVQVVAQLALAAAESTIDLQQMSKGIPVAVVKTDETWTLKVTVNGAKQQVKDLVNEKIKDTASNMVSDIVSDGLESAKKAVKNGIENVSNAAEDKLGEAIGDLRNDLQNATKAKGKELLDTAFAGFQGKFEAKMNELQTMEYATIDEAKAAVTRVFDELEGQITGFGEDQGVDAEISDALLPAARNAIGGWLSSYETELTTALDNAGEDFYTSIINKTDGFKDKLSEQVNSYVDGVYQNIEDTLRDAIGSVTTQINQAATRKVDDTTEKLKERINAKTTEILDNKLGNKDTNVGSGIKGNTKGADTDANKNSMASMFKFTYSDYLKLFLFISICADDTKALGRTADVIQLNISNAGDNSNLKHNKGKDFEMINACTYLNIEADIKVDMLFLNLDLFKKQLISYGGIVETDENGFGLSKMTTLKYKGLLGY